jgi:hypothetical protein
MRDPWCGESGLGRSAARIVGTHSCRPSARLLRVRPLWAWPCRRMALRATGISREPSPTMIPWARRKRSCRASQGTTPTGWRRHGQQDQLVVHASPHSGRRRCRRQQLGRAVQPTAQGSTSAISGSPHEPLISAGLMWAIGNSGAQAVAPTRPIRSSWDCSSAKALATRGRAVVAVPFGVTGATVPDYPLGGVLTNLGIDPVSDQLSPMLMHSVDVLHWGFAVGFSTLY